MSSRFEDLIGVTDNIVLDQFGVPLRWEKTDAAPVDLRGIVDLETETLGNGGEVLYLGKTVTVRSSELQGFVRGEKLRLLNASGVPTQTVYELQETLQDDGSLKMIELIT